MLSKIFGQRVDIKHLTAWCGQTRSETTLAHDILVKIDIVIGGESGIRVGDSVGRAFFTDDGEHMAVEV